MGDAALAMVTYADYLAIERRSEGKYEYLDGVVRAMSGGTIEHARLTSAADRMLGAALRGKPCVTFSSDLKIRVEATNRTLYADVTVVCGAIERSALDAEAVVNPRVIVEVLSDSTEGYDRGEKFRHYRRLASLAEYVLVSQRETLVEVWRREGDLWKVEESGPGEVVRLASIAVELPVDELYAGALPQA